MSIQDGKLCYTGNEYDKHGKAEDEKACKSCKSYTGTDKHIGESDAYMCGGDKMMSVYKVNEDKPEPKVDETVAQEKVVRLSPQE